MVPMHVRAHVTFDARSCRPKPPLTADAAVGAAQDEHMAAEDAAAVVGNG